jgi:hypothetical protein
MVAWGGDVCDAARRGDVDYVAMRWQLGADPSGEGADGATAREEAEGNEFGAVAGVPEGR